MTCLNFRNFVVCSRELQWWMFKATLVECFVGPPQCPAKTVEISTLKTLLIYLFTVQGLEQRVDVFNLLREVKCFSKLGAPQKLIYQYAKVGVVVHLLPPISTFPVFAVGDRKVRMFRRSCAVEKEPDNIIKDNFTLIIIIIIIQIISNKNQLFSWKILLTLNRAIAFSLYVNYLGYC